jgi:hypothetical protein
MILELIFSWVSPILLMITAIFVYVWWARSGRRAEFRPKLLAFAFICAFVVSIVAIINYDNINGEHLIQSGGGCRMTKLGDSEGMVCFD